MTSHPVGLAQTYPLVVLRQATLHGGVPRFTARARGAAHWEKV